MSAEERIIETPWYQLVAHPQSGEQYILRCSASNFPTLTELTTIGIIGPLSEELRGRLEETPVLWFAATVELAGGFESAEWTRGIEWNVLYTDQGGPTLESEWRQKLNKRRDCWQTEAQS